MAVVAALRFVQGPNSDIAGRAVKGTLVDGACIVSNGNDAGVTAWKYELLYSPPGSAVAPVTQGPGVTQTFTFTPDVAGTYRFRLTVTGITALDVNVDMRCFCVAFPNGLIAPPYQRNPAQLPLTGVGAKADEMNLGGQPFGWDGDNDPSRQLLFQALQLLDALASGGGPFLPLDGSAAMTGDLDMGLNGIHRASYVWIGADSEFSIYQLFVNDGRAFMRRLPTAPNENTLFLSMDSSFLGGSAASVELGQTYGGAASSSSNALAVYSTSNWATSTANIVDVTHGGSGATVAMAVGGDVAPLSQWVGSQFNSPQILTVPALTDVTTALANGGLGNIAAFPSAGTGLQIGDGNVFNQIYMKMDTGTWASGNGVNFTLEYSTGVGSWSLFTAEDRTSGLTHDGYIRFDAFDIPGWTVGLNSRYWIRITRTIASITTAPVVDTVQLVAGYVHGWDENADTTARSVRFERYSTAPGPDTAVTLWLDGFVGRLKIGANQLAYTSEVPSTSVIYPRLSTGLQFGGTLTINGGDPAKFDVAAGNGWVIDNYTGPSSVITPVSWAAFTAQTITGIATNNQTWVGINSAGAVVQQVTAFTSLQLRTIIELGFLSHPTHTSISSANTEPVSASDTDLDFHTLLSVMGPAVVSGNAYSANAANLTIKKSAGSTFFPGLNFANSRQNPSVTTDGAFAPATLFYVKRDPANPAGFSIAGSVGSIDPTLYDDGTGTLATVPNNSFTTQWIFFAPLSGRTFVQYGQATYTSIATAKAGISDDPFTFYSIFKEITLCTRLVVKKQCVNLSLAADAVFISAGVFGLLFSGSGGGGGGGSGTITGSAGTIDRRLTLGSGTSGTVIQPAAFVSESVTGVLEGAAGLGLTATAANPGASPTTTLWIDTVATRVRQGANILANMTDLAPLFATGLLTGGTLSINGNPALFDLAAGTGTVVDNVAYPPTVTNVVWSTFTAVTVTGLATQQTTFIGLSSAGAIIQQSVPFTLSQQRSIIVLGRLSHINFVAVDNVIASYQVSYTLGMELQGFLDLFGAVNLSGNQWSNNGANLQLTKTAGTSWSYGSNYATNRSLPSVTIDASATAASWLYVYRNPASPTGFSVSAATTVVAPNFYDDGTGTLAAVAVNNWTVQWIYLVPDGVVPTYRIHYGQAVYATQAAAKAGVTSDPFSVAGALQDAVLCTRLIVQQGTTALNGAGAQFISAGKFGSQFSSGGGGGAGGTITGTAGLVANRVILGADTSGNVIKAALAVNIPASEVVENAAGVGIPAIAANLGTAPTTTLWTASADGRFRQGANILAYLSESGGTVTVTPTSVSTQQDNYTAGGTSSTADIIRASTSGADVLFTGFLATTTTPRKYFFNVGSAGSLLLPNEHASSTAANRFATPNAREVAVPPGGCAVLIYDATIARWRVNFSSRRFIELADAPSTMVAAQGMVPAVNAGQTALVFSGLPSTFVTSVPVNAYAAPIAPGQTITAARWTPTTCRLRALVAPTVSTLTATVKANGATIGTFTLTAASLTSSAAFSVLTTRVAGDIITVELTGTDTGWSGLVVEANGTALLA